MYGAVGPMGPSGPSYHPNPGEYGAFVIFALPTLAVAGKAALAGLVGGTAVALGIQATGLIKATIEKNKHTGGLLTLPTGEVVTGDEAHAMLCAAAAPDSHLRHVDPKTGQSFCDMNPSETADYWADLPSGIAENIKDMWGGYEYRKVTSGECEPDAQGVIDPRCKGMRGAGRKIPGWAIITGAVAISVAIAFFPKKEA